MENRSLLPKQANTHNNYHSSFALFLLAILWGGYLYWRGHSITGPFIFGDESTYFSFGRDLFRGESLKPYTQYGPLFPLLISPLFYLSSLVKTYQTIRILNIIVFISAIFPAYLLSTQLFKNPWLRLLLPLCLIITPFNGLLFLIWADPLYFTLFVSTYYFIFLYFKEPTLSKSLLCSTFLALLYYTKPGAGLVIQVAAFVSVTFYLSVNWKTLLHRHKTSSLLLILACIAFDLPWMIHYRELGVSIIGYPSASIEWSWQVAHNGYTGIAFRVFLSLFYQFSYCFIGTIGMLGLCITLLVTKWQQLSSTERSITLFTLLCIGGLIVLSALGMSVYRSIDYRMPNGRYFSVLFPFIITLTLHLLFKTRPTAKRDSFIMISTIVGTILLAMIASPLYTLTPFSFNTMPDLAPIIYLKNHGLILWISNTITPKFWLRVSVPLFFGGVALCIFYLRKSNFAPLAASLMIIVIAVTSSITEVTYIVTSAGGQSLFNNLYIYLYKHKIDKSKLVFDSKMAPGNVQFLTPFWLDTQPTYAETNKIMHQKNSGFFISQDNLGLSKIYSTGGFSIYAVGNKTTF